MCTLERRGNLFIITLTGDDEHWIGPPFISSFLSLLTQINSQATPGSVLITTSHGRFFSNGFHLPWAQSAASKSAARDRILHMVHIFKPVLAALLSLPMPTIAAVSGHAAAAGFALALSHDYVLMRRDKGVLYMSEIDLGFTLPDYFAALMRSKIGSASVRRDVLLAGMKVNGETAVKLGITDAAHDGEEALMEAAVAMGEKLAKRKWEGEAYAEIRKSLYPEMSPLLNELSGKL
ncbi:enoyl-CoA delta isomerase 2, peroxisomal-like [Cucurbita maxima]|uniref:Delta(3)-Delta(2)-enoyl-CoA isomerase n=1 Tax=Cucurbita maxima TaxID=3661 RepID=A0A6J1IDW4_CUCMA|nr:enoyl-CoA delta isomerase 2, peroxisomal-like [Cucurbita maxima]XP_022975341.1 enoyl-CoA delta isomerase 2, peroxisomal-like [Cucurbita maxima]